jgi:hypothetical protein
MSGRQFLSYFLKDWKKGDKMHQIILCVLILLQNTSGDKLQFYAGANYAHYNLYMDEMKAQGKWQLGGEVGIANIIRGIGLNFRAAYLKYPVTQYQLPLTYRYIPLVVSSTFNLLPFFREQWLNLDLETGFGLYLWQGRINDEVFVLPTAEKMDEKDLGFFGGFTLTIRPLNFVGIEATSQYHYIASANIYKYGYFDKDEKLWANSLGLKFFFP